MLAEPLSDSVPVCDRLTASVDVESQQECSKQPSLLMDRIVGKGSFGIVWSVRDKQTGKIAAVKKIPCAFISELSCVRTLRELRLMCELKHDNLLSSLYVLPITLPFSCDGVVSVVSELMDNNLLALIKFSAEQMTEDRIKVLMYQLLRGVKFLHSSDIIHRDLKPGNILINRDGRLKICDFGTARPVVHDCKKQMRCRIGTRYYRAPELLTGCVHYGVEVDMWSVGCIFAKMLDQYFLFEGPNSSSQLEVITNVIGTPTVEDVGHLSSLPGFRSLLSPVKPNNLKKLFGMTTNASSEALDLLSQLLQFNPKKRLTVTEALCHPYLEKGRHYYHTELCSCCPVVDGCTTSCEDLEPSSGMKFDIGMEKRMSSLTKSHAVLLTYINSCSRGKKSPFKEDACRQ